MTNERLLDSLKERLEKIKSDINTKKGELKAVLQQLEEKFGVKDLKAAYGKFDTINAEIESKKEKRDELLKQAGERLESYER